MSQVMDDQAIRGNGEGCACFGEDTRLTMMLYLPAAIYPKVPKASDLAENESGDVEGTPGGRVNE